MTSTVNKKYKYKANFTTLMNLLNKIKLF